MNMFFCFMFGIYILHQKGGLPKGLLGWVVEKVFVFYIILSKYFNNIMLPTKNKKAMSSDCNIYR